MVTVGAVAERCTGRPATESERRTWADATTEMALGSTERATR